jgi:signal transduction histidine kinase
VKVIRRSAEHLSSLIDGLLDISRIEGGVLKLSRDRLNFTEFVDQLEDMFRLQAARKGIGFRCNRAAHLPGVVHTDERRLRQILINLLSNAVKYTSTGHAALTVRYRNQVAEFEVSDTGMGIAPEDLERVFGPFERGSGADHHQAPDRSDGRGDQRHQYARCRHDIHGAADAVRGTAGCAHRAVTPHPWIRRGAAARTRDR